MVYVKVYPLGDNKIGLYQENFPNTKSKYKVN